MKFIISRYNHPLEWLKDYPGDHVIYDRSDKEPHVEGAISVPNIGTDIYDKFTYIIDNYDNLPDVAVYTKANLFKYITKEEFDKVKDNKTFTPLHTMNHKVYSDALGPVCFYDNKGMFNEVNNFWYLYPLPAKFAPTIIDFFNMKERLYNAFSPGSNYILTKENIRKHPKEVYEKFRKCLDWDVYPGDAQLLERNLYYLWS
jgi:hypothetical protein